MAPTKTRSEMTGNIIRVKTTADIIITIISEEPLEDLDMPIGQVLLETEMALNSTPPIYLKQDGIRVAVRIHLDGNAPVIQDWA